MALHLLLGQRLHTPRKLRFPGRFLDDITALVGSVGLEVITRVHKVRAKASVGKGRGRAWASQAGAPVLPSTSWLQYLRSPFLDQSVGSATVS